MITVRTDNAWEALPQYLPKGAPVLFVTGHTFAAKAQQFLHATGGAGAVITKPAGNTLALQAVPQPAFLPQVMVAIGGGSVIDLAKLLLHHMRVRPRFVAVPTTAGSGSEATPFAVAYEDGEKISVASPALLPDWALLDPGLLSGQTAFQRAVSGMDALAQAIESIWSLHATEASRALAGEAIRLLLQHLPAFVEGREEAGRAVLEAAHGAGKAIAMTRTTGPHALSYYLTSRHGIPHGQAVAFFLPLFFLYNASCPALEASVFPALGVRDAEEGFRFMRKFIADLGLPVQWQMKVDTDALLRSVNRERFGNNPLPFDADRLRRLILQYLAA